MADVKNKENAVDYAFWNIPDSGNAVIYSLSVFHDIEFVVNEGFRKIPHGGIETGGLLFGTIDANGTRVEAFREVACEHASGPSFSLSEKDLVALSEQIASCRSDVELEGWRPVGWFLAHTRSSLLLSDRELLLFNRIFPTPGQLTVLVKPERFQATRFGFLVRAADGSVPRDATENAVILPMPGSKGRSSDPVPSIPAPAVPINARHITETPEQPKQSDRDFAPPQPELPKAVDYIHNPELEPGPLPFTRSEEGLPPPVPRRTTGRLTLEQVQLAGEQEQHKEEHHRSKEEDQQHKDEDHKSKEEDHQHKDEDQQPKEPEPELSQHKESADSMAVVSTGQRLRPQEGLDPREQLELVNRRRREISSARMVFVLPLAALLGCVVGYIGYLQVPSPIIPLTVRSLSQTVLVSWPPEETRGSVYAAVRIDDGTPVLLSPEEKSAGQVEVSAATDIKVELIARNWLRDSRGIVRYIKAANLRSPMKIP